MLLKCGKLRHTDRHTDTHTSFHLTNTIVIYIYNENNNNNNNNNYNNNAIIIIIIIIMEQWFSYSKKQYISECRLVGWLVGWSVS